MFRNIEFDLFIAYNTEVSFNTRMPPHQNGNNYTSIPVGYFVHLQGHCRNFQIFLEYKYLKLEFCIT